MNAIGAHDVWWWVKGQKIVGERVYLLDGSSFKAARIVPQMGWIWP